MITPDVWTVVTTAFIGVAIFSGCCAIVEYYWGYKSLRMQLLYTLILCCIGGLIYALLCSIGTAIEIERLKP